MTSDADLITQDSDYAQHIQEVLNELRQMQQTPQLVTSPDELEALEREIRQRTDRLGSLLVGYHLQQALDSDALQAEQEQLVRQWPSARGASSLRCCLLHSRKPGTNPDYS